MNPIISNINQEEAGVLKFTLSGVNVSLANAIRRIILSEIQCLVFKTIPYNENNAIIHINTSRLNNEIIKQRLSAIPIHIDDLETPYDELLLIIDEKNDTDTIKIITTNDFKILNTKTEKFCTKEYVNKVFPHDPITGDYIDFVRLRSKITDDINGEQLKMECKFSIGMAKDDGAFNVVSCCAYGNTPDPININKAWSDKEKILHKEKKTDEEITFIKRDWYSLEANRYFKNDSFDFIIESIGIYDNIVLVKKACEVMIKKVETFKQDILSQFGIIVKPIINTIPNCYEIDLTNEDYTLGKVIEFVLYNTYYKIENPLLTFCAFKKLHPHINNSQIRIAFKINPEKEQIISILINSSDNIIAVYKSIMDSV